MQLMPERQIAEIRERCSDPVFEPAYQTLKGEVEAFLSIPMDPPDQPAGYYHDYFCPEHALELIFDPTTPEEHKCPQDGQVYAGEPYNAAWRWFVNNRLSSAAFRLALMWRIDQNEASLRRTEAILLGYARRYRGYEPGPKKPYGQGKATFQSLDEAVWLIPLVQGYDLIRADLTSETRRQIEQALFAPAAEHILQQKYYRLHNIECWHNTALAAVGCCLDDGNLIRIALDDDFGFRHQLAEGVREDGFWWEGSLSYHFYTLAAMMTFAQVMTGVDDTLWQADRLKAMFLAPVNLAYPDLRLPATNDCWFFTSLTENVCHGVPPAAGFYEIAYGLYGDPMFARVLSHNYTQHSRDSLETLLYGKALPEEAGERNPQGTNFKQSGYAVLRNQKSPESQTYLMLKYGPHGGGHGHPDKLSISFYSSGYPVSPDLGTPGYGIGLNQSWYRQTLSHNTMLVDGKSQPPAEGKLVFFDDGSGEDFGVADARVSWDEEPYQGVSMRRVILWTEAYFLDIFQVVCDRERQLDWVCRFQDTLTTKTGLSKADPVSLQGDGYNHISKAVSEASDGPVHLQWSHPKGKLSVFLPQEGGTEIIRGAVPFNPASEKSDILIRRRLSKSTTFLTLIHPWVEAPVVTKVRPVAADLPEGAWALWITVGQEQHLWIVCHEAQQEEFSDLALEADRVFLYTL